MAAFEESLARLSALVERAAGREQRWLAGFARAYWRCSGFSMTNPREVVCCSLRPRSNLPRGFATSSVSSVCSPASWMTGVRRRSRNSPQRPR